MTNGTIYKRFLSILFCIFLSVFCSSSEGLVVHSQNSSAYFRTPTFAWYHGQFEVTAPLVQLETKKDCDSLKNLQGRVLITWEEILEELCGFRDSRDPHEFVRDHGSVGLIRVSTLNPHLMEFAAWKYSPLPFQNGEQVPAVAASQDDAHAILALLRASNGRPLNVTISSDDPNTAVEVIKSPWTVTLFSAAGLLSAFNTYFAILKVISFKLDKDASMSYISWFILLPEIFANSVRLILSVNTVFFAEGALNWSIYRIMLSISFPLGFTSTLAVSYGLYWAFFEANLSESPQKSRVFVLLFLASAALVVLVDITNSIFTAFYGELFNAFAIAIFYAIVQIPLIHFFLVYGTRVANTLMAGDKHVDKFASDRVIKFVHRLRWSGFALIANMASTALFATLGNKSFSSWYILYGFLLHTWGWVGFFQIAAVRPATELSLASWLHRRVSALYHSLSSHSGKNKVFPQSS